MIFPDKTINFFYLAVTFLLDKPAPPTKPAPLALPSGGAENAYIASLRRRAEEARERAIEEWEREYGDGQLVLRVLQHTLKLW